MNVYAECLEFWGSQRQLIKTAEECSELVQAIMKFLLNQGEMPAILDEASDVYLMIMQIREMVGHETWEKLVNIKLDAVKERIRRSPR